MALTIFGTAMSAVSGPPPMRTAPSTRSGYASTGEICRTDPGSGDDVVVVVTDPLVFARWHLGLVEWGTALRTGGIQVSGSRALSRALPRWNGCPDVWRERRAEAEDRREG
jgi:hypothetical protein